jgi:hypothetical protein
LPKCASPSATAPTGVAIPLGKWCCRFLAHPLPEIGSGRNQSHFQLTQWGRMTRETTLGEHEYAFKTANHSSEARQPHRAQDGLQQVVVRNRERWRVQVFSCFNVSGNASHGILRVEAHYESPYQPDCWSSLGSLVGERLHVGASRRRAATGGRFDSYPSRILATAG